MANTTDHWFISVVWNTGSPELKKDMIEILKEIPGMKEDVASRDEDIWTMEHDPDLQDFIDTFSHKLYKRDHGYMCWTFQRIDWRKFQTNPGIEYEFSFDQKK